MNTVSEISVEELKQKVDAGEEFQLLDVRESFERDICVLEHDIHIPMNEIPNQLNQLDPKKLVVVYCRSGQRSYNVAAYLMQHGFDNALNLRGGILDWALKIDSSKATY